MQIFFIIYHLKIYIFKNLIIINLAINVRNKYKIILKKKIKNLQLFITKRIFLTNFAPIKKFAICANYK